MTEDQEPNPIAPDRRLSETHCRPDVSHSAAPKTHPLQRMAASRV